MEFGMLEIIGFFAIIAFGLAVYVAASYADDGDKYDDDQW